MQLNYKIENIEDKNKPWLIFINGLFAGLNSWDESVPYFTDEFRVLRYDGRGQGDSPRPVGAYQLKHLVEDLKNLVDSLNIDKASLVGLSNGGRIALEFANLYPRYVTNIVASDTYDEPSPLLQLKLKSWLDANRKGGPIHRFEVATPWIWGETIIQQRPELLDFYRERAGLEKVHVIEGLIEGAIEDHRIDITNIHCPTLLIVGREDLLTPPFMHERMLKKLTQGALKIVPGGHASLLEYPLTLKNTVLPWLLECRQEMATSAFEVV
ncbi:MAG: alpha/beta hydrolase [Bacteriovoracaceae bacterium]|nr:alpha/beta hydrolase [Bacteriovoracaceae bacterium]